MADLINIRLRPGVRINLHPADIKNICVQPEVLASFTEGELAEMIDCFHLELNYRTNKGEKNARTSGKE